MTFFTIGQAIAKCNRKFVYNLKKAAMSTKCKVAVCQLTATNNKENNLNTVKKLVNDAVNQNAKIVFLPEAVDFIADNAKESKVLAEPLQGPLMTEYKNLAKKNNIWLSVGGFHEKQDETTIYNSHVLIDANGEIVSLYRKIHLFDVSIPEKNINLCESKLNSGGCRIIPSINSPAGRLALAICYDLRFPELSTILTKLGAQILTYPSAFTHATGLAHWEVLLRARAIENQCYVVAAAQYGTHNAKRKSYGHALIVDPWGTIIAECPKYEKGSPETNESFAVAEIDIDFLLNVRREMPVFEHRRNDIYSLNTVAKESYSVSDKDNYNFASKIIPGATVFYRSKYSYAFTNIRCVVPGHVLVSPVRVASRLTDLSQEELADLFQTAVAVQKALEMEYDAASSTICIQDGENAGQTIPHVHVHVMPRKKGDFAKNDDIYLELAKHDRDADQPIRPLEEMIAEARKLRLHFTS